MSFGNITIGSTVYADHGNGVYSDNSIGFSDPQNEIRVRPATAVRKDGTLDLTLTAILEKDDAEGKRHQAVVTCYAKVPAKGPFNSTELRSMAARFTSGFDAAAWDDILQGKM